MTDSIAHGNRTAILPDSAEKLLVLEALEKNNYSRRAAARALGVTHDVLRRRLRAWGIDGMTWQVQKEMLREDCARLRSALEASERQDEK